MNITALEALKRLYSGNRELIVMTDADWNIQWSSQPEEHPELRTQLHLPEDFWENGTFPVYLREKLYACEINSSCEDGLRVLRFTAMQNGLVNWDTMIDILQSITSSCTALYTMLEDADVDEFRAYPNAIMANVLRIYRCALLEQEIGRIQRGCWVMDTFDAADMVIRLCKHMEDLMRDFLDVQFFCNLPKLFVQGDIRGFQCALLSAFLLSVRRPEKNLHVSVRLTSDGTQAMLRLIVKPGARERTDLQGQLHNFGALDAERLLLTEYCRFLGTEPEFTEHEDTVTFRMQIPLSEDRHTMRLNTTSASIENGYFNVFSVLLSRLRYREFFV